MNEQAYNKKVFTKLVKDIKYALKLSKLPHTENDIANTLDMSLDDFQNGLIGIISTDQVSHAFNVCHTVLLDSMPGFREFQRKEAENNNK